MKKYRVYTDYLYDDSGFLPSGIYNLEVLVKVLDFYINIEQRKKQILVIEENHENNSDFPVFHYLGQADVFDEFVNGYVKQELARKNASQPDSIKSLSKRK